MPNSDIRTASNDELLKGEDLPDNNQIVRYVKPSLVEDDGSANGFAFTLRPRESDLSVNRLDAFAPNKNNQLAEVCRLIRLDIGPNCRFAEMNVGSVCKHVAEELDSLRIVHDPLEKTDNFEEDPSHALILGLPPGETDHAMAIGDLFTERVTAMHKPI